MVVFAPPLLALCSCAADPPKFIKMSVPLFKKGSLIMIFSVCIATYKRPTLLEQTLASILAQVLPHDIIIETIVVDNDPERSAAGIVEKHHDTDSISFKYFSQPIKNISLTRNMAVHNASGTYLVLIDDDEVASPRWIATLLKAADKYGADGVFGPFYPFLTRARRNGWSGESGCLWAQYPQRLLEAPPHSPGVETASSRTPC